MACNDVCRSGNTCIELSRGACAYITEALARNPAARAGIQFALILGLALIESLALYTFVIIFVKVK